MVRQNTNIVILKADDMPYEPSQEAINWLRNYHGSIDSTALLMAFDAGKGHTKRLKEAGDWAVWLLELDEIQRNLDPDWGDPIEILRMLKEAGCKDPNKS